VKTKNFVLDSFALLAYFQGEPGGTTVRDILKEASAGSVSVMLSVVNLGEIYYKDTVAKSPKVAFTSFRTRSGIHFNQ
jgi:PIN domain nuclease of toxin-antitoxin system